MADISMINRWANVLFRGTDWIDKDGDRRIDVDELRPAEKAPAEFQKSMEGQIRDSYIPLIKALDKNSDGLSAEEIGSFVSYQGAIDFGLDLGPVKAALKKEGRYKMPGAPIEFVTEDNIPEEVKNSKEYQAELERTIFSGLPTFLGIARGKEKGLAAVTVLNGDSKYGLVLVPKKLFSIRETMAESALRHELVHAKQYFSGKLMNILCLRDFILKSGKIPWEDAEAPFYMIFKTIPELEAHQIDMRMAAEGKREDELYFAKKSMGSIFEEYKQARGFFIKNGDTEVVELIDSIRKEYISDEEMAQLGLKY